MSEERKVDVLRWFADERESWRHVRSLLRDGVTLDMSEGTARAKEIELVVSGLIDALRQIERFSVHNKLSGLAMREVAVAALEKIQP